MAKKSHTFKGQAKPYGQSGHFHEPMRHSLQARGIKTGNLSGIGVGDLVYYKGRQWDVVDYEDGDYTLDDGAGRTRYVSEEALELVTSKDTDGDGVSDAEDCEPNDPTKQDDLELKDLGQFTGTTQYHKLSPFSQIVGTDGVGYVLQNGYHWFVSDMVIAVSMKPKLKSQEFLVVKLKVNPDKTAVGIVEDGNNKVLYRQKYDYTNAKRDLKFYIADGVMMLPSEY